MYPFCNSFWFHVRSLLTFNGRKFSIISILHHFVCTGQWFCGKLHGEGIISWPDGRRYEGQFRQSVYHGPGKLEVPAAGGVTIYEGAWKNGKLEGKGIIKSVFSVAL